MSLLIANALVSGYAFSGAPDYNAICGATILDRTDTSIERLIVDLQPAKLARRARAAVPDYASITAAIAASSHRAAYEAYDALKKEATPKFREGVNLWKNTVSASPDYGSVAAAMAVASLAVYMSGDGDAALNHANAIVADEATAKATFTAAKSAIPDYSMIAKGMIAGAGLHEDLGMW